MSYQLIDREVKITDLIGLEDQFIALRIFVEVKVIIRHHIRPLRLYEFITYLFLDSILLFTERDVLIDALSTESLLSAECPELGQLSHLVSLSWSSEKLL